MVIIINVDRQDRSKNFLLHSLEMRVSSNDNSGLDEISPGVIAPSADNDFSIGGILCIINIWGDLIEGSPVYNGVHEIGKVADIAYLYGLDCFNKHPL
ncbi:MAG: hypothetical protein DDT32_02198 [Syntrophomonadaceae bacterium]|nr:hypothetical protein [Bacillota bacterium]